jgi:hypothetical protein
MVPDLILPAINASISDIVLRVFYIPPAANTFQFHLADCAVSHVGSLNAVGHWADVMTTYLSVTTDFDLLWQSRLPVITEAELLWNDHSLVKKTTLISWQTYLLVQGFLRDNWNVYLPAGAQFVLGWSSHRLVIQKLADNWCDYKTALKAITDQWKDYKLVQVNATDHWYDYKLVRRSLVDDFVVFPPAEFKEIPSFDLTPLDDVVARRCGGQQGFNPWRFVELYGGEVIEPTAFEPDPVTYRSSYYYNTTTNRLYMKIITTNKPMEGIIRAHWKAVSF